MDVPFVTVERVTLRPQLGAWLRGDRVMDMTVEGAVVNYVLGADEAHSQTELDPEWVRELVAHIPFSVDGLVLRTVYPTVPARVDYRLTETGAGLTHLVKALADWSLAHRAAIAEARDAYDLAHPGHDIR